jgi:hypothetical protein
MAASSSSFVATLTLAFFLFFSGSSVTAQVSTDYYTKSCPKLFSTVKSTVQSAISKEARMGASLLRLFFHDCFVNVNFLFQLKWPQLIFMLLYFYNILRSVIYNLCIYTWWSYIYIYIYRDVTAPFSLMTHPTSKERRMQLQTGTLLGDSMWLTISSRQ